jgi:hypothetical protein
MINLRFDKLMTNEQGPREQIELGKLKASNLFTRITIKNLRTSTNLARTKRYSNENARDTRHKICFQSSVNHKGCLRLC